MKNNGRSKSITVHELLGRQVYDADGKKVGRVEDLVAERRGDEFRVTGIVVGRWGLIDRFGWSRTERGPQVPWDEIRSLEPKITLRTRGVRGRGR
jgi:sporulation protein YlmC with PRC-barrel domain